MHGRRRARCRWVRGGGARPHGWLQAALHDAGAARHAGSACTRLTPRQRQPTSLPPLPVYVVPLQWTDSRKLLEAAIGMEQMQLTSMTSIPEGISATPSGRGWGWGGGGWGDGALDAAEQRLQVGGRAGGRPGGWGVRSVSLRPRFLAASGRPRHAPTPSHPA